MKVTLPWPPAKLSPNARTHWREKAKATKAYRERCAWMTKAAIKETPPEGKLYLWITFYPTDKRHRDDDNCFASFKAGKDGIADALGIDDVRFVSRPYLSTEVRKGGEVVVSITAGPEVPQ